MKVFISWSGDRSRALAQALREWLPMVLQYAIPWLSETDIHPGQRWATEIAKELEESMFGIICVTRENVTAPWILLEAGALAKFLQHGRVIPLLLDVDFQDLAGPLAQFQAKKVERIALGEIIRSINEASKTRLEDIRLGPQIDALWSEFTKRIDLIPKGEAPTKQTRPQSEILEELVSNVRGLDGRFRDIIDEVPQSRRTKRRLHPIMLSELARDLKLGRDDPIPILIVASLLRDDFPWIYELGVDAYRAKIDGNSLRSDDARQRFSGAINVLRRETFLKDPAENDMYMLIEELAHYLEPVPKIRKPKARRKSAKVGMQVSTKDKIEQ